jgi:hypothetical protein
MCQDRPLAISTIKYEENIAIIGIVGKAYLSNVIKKRWTIVK